MQLEDGHSLFDYDVGLNDIIQLMVRPVPANSHATTHTSTIPAQNGTREEEEREEEDKMDTVSMCVNCVLSANEFCYCFVLSF